MPNDETQAKFICIAHEPDRVAAWIGVEDGELRLLGGTEDTGRKATAVLEELRNEGVHMRVERVEDGKLLIDVIALSPDDPRYQAAVAREFRVRGWESRVCGPLQAVIWQRLYTLPLPSEIRQELKAALDQADEDALSALSALLQEAEKELQNA